MIKYTSSGKKVAVIGKLNSEETIVQEVFVKEDGSEIPSGENFVVKSLHDAPVKSWQEKECEEVRKRYEIEKPRLLKELSALKKDVNRRQRVSREFQEAIKTHCEIEWHDIFTQILKFATGEISHVAVSRYGVFKILTVEDALDDGEHGFRQLNVLNFFWEPTKKFSWNMSGREYQTVVPCVSFEEAKYKLEELIRERLESSSFSRGMLQAKEQYGLNEPTAKDIEEYYDSELKRAQKRLSEKKDDAAAIQKEIDLLTKLKKEVES